MENIGFSFPLADGLRLEIRALSDSGNTDAQPNAEVFARIAAKLVNSEKVRNKDIFADPESADIIPGVELARHHHLLIEKFEFSLVRPCQCCGQGNESTDVSWPDARSFLPSDAADLRVAVSRRINKQALKLRVVKRFADGELYVQNGLETIRLSQEHSHEQKVDLLAASLFKKIAVCAMCREHIREHIDAIFALACAEFDEKESRRLQEIENERLARQQEIDEEKRAIEEYERENPKYLAVTSPIAQAAEFNSEINRRIKLGYVVWGAPLMDKDGNLVQVILREDVLAKRDEQRGSAAKNKQSRRLDDIPRADF